MQASSQPGIHGKLGAKLRELRVAHNLSVRTLAARVGFSPSFISQVESEAVSPSLASLEKIAAELGVSLAQLFSSLEDTPRTVLRVDERPTFESAWSHSVVEVLTDTAASRKLSSVLATFAPGGVSGTQPTVMQQDTFALVLEGALLLVLDGEPVELTKGDTVYLQAGVSSLWKNESTADAALLLVSVAGRVVALPELLPDDHTASGSA